MVQDVRGWQRRIFSMLWLAYASFYLGRVNLAIALPAIQETLGFSAVQVGWIGSVFFWVYAVGQLVNGTLGDRIASRLFVALGLLGTALLNGAFGMVSSLGLMMLLWGANGIFQSMGWGPIVRTASMWSLPGQRAKLSAILGTSFVVGALVSWGVSGQILQMTSHYAWVFWIPAMYLALLAVLWYIRIPNHPKDVGLAEVFDTGAGLRPANTAPKTMWADTKRFLLQKPLALLAVTTMFQGMIKDGINMWVPIMLVQSFELGIGRAAGFSLFIPSMGFLGVLGASYLLQVFGSDERRTLLWLFMAGAAAAAGTAFGFAGGPLRLSLFLGLCAALINGTNVLLLSSIPMAFGRRGKASTLAGFLDFSSYVGAGFMALVTGVVASRFGWPAVVGTWSLLFCLGWLSLWINNDLTTDEP